MIFKDHYERYRALMHINRTFEKLRARLRVRRENGEKLLQATQSEAERACSGEHLQFKTTQHLGNYRFYFIFLIEQKCFS